jgi:hypothetical protein
MTMQYIIVIIICMSRMGIRRNYNRERIIDAKDVVVPQWNVFLVIARMEETWALLLLSHFKLAEQIFLRHCREVLESFGNELASLVNI